MENRFKKARTIHNRHGAQSTQEVAKETGVTKSLIEDIESTVGRTRNVGYLTVKKLAQHYGVSADYLLGLSNTPSIKEDIQAVCKITGLSENSIAYLLGKQDIMWLINGMLEHPAFQDVLSRFRDYILLAERDTDYLRILGGVPGSLVSRKSLPIADILDESTQNELKDNGYSVAPASLVAQSILCDVNFSLRQVLDSIAIKRGEDNGQRQTE